MLQKCLRIAAKLEAYNKKLALYETAVNAVSPDRGGKDAMDIDLMLWFLREVVNRESFLDEALAPPIR